MKNEIKDHYREEDVQRMKLHSDIEHWNEELDFMKKEIDFFTTLLKTPLLEKAILNKENTDKHLQTLAEMAKHNESYSAAVLNFSNTLEGLKECEDLQCETYFLNSHEELRNDLKKYGQKFQELKTEIFENLKSEA